MLYIDGVMTKEQNKIYNKIVAITRTIRQASTANEQASTYHTST